ncbi:hypothetical protein OMW55_05280 [Sphingomonas sp. BN140010]|uniref:DUF4136 domain-containing protein n=1 Tax=Sphingomonas arvum TaxID=2992113 RepID=A0ABT3JDQ3_9SPHN|nr:hypothetical protein [Sphingomonas sp. BN140010]MCW3797220.1 hypothetical protein [Sphingomonas sp. BN140010]
MPRLVSQSIVLSATALLLSACATSTPYQPLGSSHARGGYSDQRIDQDHYRVSFSGNDFTSRKEVENYLLLRAAQVTLQNGYDGFTLVSKQTDPTVRTEITEPFSPGPYGYWGPSWRYRLGGLGWRSWSPWGGGAFWADNLDVNTVTSYEASAEIAFYRGAKPNSPVAFDARQVIASIEPETTKSRL